MRHAPIAVILAAAIIAAGAALLFGGPRLGYVPGIVFSAVLAVAVLWRYPPSMMMRWLVVMLLAAYYGGGALMVGTDVLAHVLLGSDALRYDRMIHVVGAAISVLFVAQIAGARYPLSAPLVIMVAIGAGLLVEAVELATALILPKVFSYDLIDSSLDVVGNAAGLAVGAIALLWTKARPPGLHRTAGSTGSLH